MISSQVFPPNEQEVGTSLKQFLVVGAQVARLASAALIAVQLERERRLKLGSEELTELPQSYHDEDDHHDGE